MTGESPSDPTFDAQQSETSLAVFQRADGTRGAVVAFNDDSYEVAAGRMWYSPDRNQRQVFYGASQTGWSFSPDGHTWNYQGKLTPPTGWALIWGDPSVAVVPANSPTFKDVIVMSSLGSPDAQWRKANNIAPSAPSNSAAWVGDILPVSGPTPLAGMCVATMNTSGGLQRVQCFADSANSFYDGTSVAINATGEVCATSWNFFTKSAVVWCEDSPLGTFVQKPNPFPGYTIDSHVQILASNDGINFYVYAHMSAPRNGFVLARGTTYPATFDGVPFGTGWDAPVEIVDGQTSGETLVDISPGAALPHTIRRAQDFALLEAGYGFPTLYFAYTTQAAAGAPYFIQTTTCRIDLATCFGFRPIRGTPASGSFQSIFSPRLAFAPDGWLHDSSGWQFVNTQVQLAYDQVEGNDHISGWALSLSDQAPSPTLNLVASSHPLCIAPAGDYKYVGDYDQIGFLKRDDTSPFAPHFLGTGTNSDLGCEKRSSLYSTRNQHVTALLWH